MGNFCSFLEKNILYSGYSVICKRTKWATAYIILLFRKRNSRMYKYDMKANYQPFNVGLFIPLQEWDLECLSENQETDEMICIGMNSDGDCLAVQISRECVCDFSALFLKINGYIYTLPVKLNCLQTKDRKTFGYNRFYIQCVAPFRKWKIFFNGMLRETCPGRDDDRIVHVRFSFNWVASSGVFDLMSDYSLANMADNLSEIKWNCLKPPIDKLLAILNEYHQSGMLIGTVKIGNKDQQDVIMWGSRRHSLNLRYEGFEKSLSLFGHAENGLFFYIKIMSFSTFIKRNISGYIMLPNGSLKSARFHTVRRMMRQNKTILFFRIKAGGQNYSISAFFYGYGQFFGRGISETMSLSVVDVIINGSWGGGIMVERIRAKASLLNTKCSEISCLLKSKSVSGFSFDPLVLSFEDPVCLYKHLTGNIGSSLAKLMQLQEQISGCNVPEGLVITTSGCEEYYSSVEGLISTLKENVFKYDADQLKNFCERVVEKVSNSYFPPAVHDCLRLQLNKIMRSSESICVCIYPSLSGPDTEVQLLEAYLDRFPNVVGFPEVMKYIKKCWASQFSFGAVQCKMSTGQPLCMPLAVIVQKTVPFETSGIISTCDCRSGNPSVMEIREGIDKVDPNEIHIIILNRDLKNNFKISDTSVVYGDDSNKNSLENREKLPKLTLARSIDKLIFDASTANFMNGRRLSKGQVMLLGKLACKLEKYFLYPLCIEWCLYKNKLYLIQVRPITLINVETKSDIIHYCDSYFRTEEEWLSVSSTGEAFVEPISPLGINILNFCVEVTIAKLKWINSELGSMPQVPYYPKFLVYSHYHMLYSLADGVFRFHKNFDSFFFKTLPLISNLKPADEGALLDIISHRHGNTRVSFRLIYNCFKVLFFSGSKSKLMEEKINNYDLSLKLVDSATDILDIVSYHYQDLTEPFEYYMNCTYKAIFWNMFVLYILGKLRGDESIHEDVQRDFNFLMSALSVSKEGDLVWDLLALSCRIANHIDPSVFKEMLSEDARIWLEDAEIDEEVQFSKFLKKHGHRCEGEADIFKKSWNMDSLCVVRVLQDIVPFSQSYFRDPTFSLDHVFNQLPVMPNFFQKLILKYAVPKCIKSLKEAKRAKSNLLKVACIWRKAFYDLANKAVKEFRIPFPEALFFLSLDEIKHLLEAGSPQLVTKALKCWEIFHDKSVFPPMPIGYPFLLKNTYINKRLKVGLALTGCPMSRGTAVGPAVVAKKLEEIAYIERGSVLITYSPSIVWSLYFPILGGFAADAGGMLSDGAIAAREYGLPCVINLLRASHVFKTGDRVFIDGNVGVLRRVS